MRVPFSFSNVCFCSLCKEHNARDYVPKYLTFLSLVDETQFPLLCVFLSPSRMSASVPCPAASFCRWRHMRETGRGGGGGNSGMERGGKYSPEPDADWS